MLYFLQVVWNVSVTIPPPGNQMFKDRRQFSNHHILSPPPYVSRFYCVAQISLKLVAILFSQLPPSSDHGHEPLRLMGYFFWEYKGKWMWCWWWQRLRLQGSIEQYFQSFSVWCLKWLSPWEVSGARLLRGKSLTVFEIIKTVLLKIMKNC